MSFSNKIAKLDFSCKTTKPYVSSKTSKLYFLPNHKITFFDKTAKSYLLKS